MLSMAFFLWNGKNELSKHFLAFLNKVRKCGLEEESLRGKASGKTDEIGQ